MKSIRQFDKPLQVKKQTPLWIKAAQIILVCAVFVAALMSSLLVSGWLG